MFYNFNTIVNESMQLSFYSSGLNKGHQHRNEKGYTDLDPEYRRKHLNMVPEYVKKTQDTATEKIRSINYDNNTFQPLNNIEVNKILAKYNIDINNLKKYGNMRLGRSGTIIVYNPFYHNFYLKKMVKINEK